MPETSQKQKTLRPKRVYIYPTIFVKNIFTLGCFSHTFENIEMNLLQYNEPLTDFERIFWFRIKQKKIIDWKRKDAENENEYD